MILGKRTNKVVILLIVSFVGSVAFQYLFYNDDVSLKANIIHHNDQDPSLEDRRVNTD